MGKKASERTLSYAGAGSPLKKGRVKSTTTMEFGFITNGASPSSMNKEKGSMVYAVVYLAGKDRAENGATTKGAPIGAARQAKGYEFTPTKYENTVLGLMENRNFDRFTPYFIDAAGCEIELIYQDCWIKTCDYNVSSEELNTLIDETQKFVDSLLPVWEANQRAGVLDANQDWTITPNNAFHVIRGRDHHLHEVIMLKDILQLLSENDLARSYLGVDKAMSAALTTTTVPKQDIWKKLDTLGHVIYGYSANMHSKFIEACTPPIIPQVYTPKK